MGLPVFCIPITPLGLCSSGKLNLPISSGFKAVYLLHYNVYLFLEFIIYATLS